MQTNLGAEARPASDDHARHIIASHVARHNAIGDEERSRANMIADDAIRREIGEHFFFGVTRERAQNVKRFSEEIGLVIGVDALQDRDQSLKAHAGIDMFGGKRIELSGADAVVLDEHQIPNFDKSVGIQNFPSDFFFGRMQIEMDFRARTARTGIRHFPEVIFSSHIKKMIRTEAGLFDPVGSRLLRRWEYRPYHP